MFKPNGAAVFLSRALLLSLIHISILACGRVHLPRVTDPYPQASAEKQRGLIQWVRNDYTTPMGDATCRELSGEFQDIPRASLAEYPALLRMIKRLSPLIDDEQIALAHLLTLRSVVSETRDFLLSRGKSSEWQSFSEGVQRNIDFFHPNVETDLENLIHKALEVSEDSVCAYAFLNRFFWGLVQNLDPFGRVERGDGSTRNEGWAYRPPPLVREERRDHFPPTVVLTVMNWEESEQLRVGFLDLSRRAQAGNLRSLVLDLRSAGGDNLEVLNWIRRGAAEEGGWGRVPLAIWVDSGTRGAAEVFAAEQSVRRNVITIGTRTRGYARRKCNSSEVLDAGMQPLFISISCEIIQPLAGTSPDRSGFSPAIMLPAARLEDVIRELELLIGNSPGPTE